MTAAFGENKVINVCEISVNYGPCSVLRGISLDLDEGKITAVLGPNGAGKTTLIRALNGVIPIAKGEIVINGRPLNSLSRREVARQIAVVAQENETRFPVRVSEFVLSGRFARGRAFGWETETDIAIADRAIRRCDLAGYEARLMNRLSGGERQRAVLARALAAESRILMLDEPTANLDLSHQAKMFRLVREICHSEGVSAMIITHELNVAAEFADQVILLSEGTIFAAGPPAKVLNEENLMEVFGISVLRDDHPVTGNARITTIF